MTKTAAKKKIKVSCPYCGEQALLVSDTAVYKRSYRGKVWLCAPCEAWVGCHVGSERPLGRLAKVELRKLKMEAHGLLDPLWRGAMRFRGWKQSRARGKAYKWLAAKMGIDQAECHIGMFDEARAQLAIDILRKREPIAATDADGNNVDNEEAEN